MSMFQKATKKQARLRMALIGPSGSGKTYTSLRIASRLGKKIAVIDTEKGSASKYSDQFGFDVLELETFGPQRYIDAIKAAGDAGYEVLVIDSLSHAWNGKGGALELVDQATARSKSGNSYTAWRDVTPLHNDLIDAILRAKCHVIATMRVKTEYVIEKDEKTGKSTPRKVGLAPVQRDGMEYEFDVVGDMDNAQLVITKTRCPAIAKAVVNEPGSEFADTLKAWLTDGVEAPEPMREPKPTPQQQMANDLQKAKAAKVWKEAQARGMDTAAFKEFITKTLGQAKPSTTWTEEDFDALEANLPPLSNGHASASLPV
jgi:hypothetical protein